MKKLFFLLLTMLMSVSIVKADDVSVEQALQTACQFAQNSPTTQSALSRKATTTGFNPQLAYCVKSGLPAAKDNVYIINLGEDQGFVIVSGVTGTDGEVLGYCDHGFFSYDNCPIQLKDVLALYSAGIDSLRQNPVLATRSVAKSRANIGDIKVGPLLTTTWNQWNPFNKYCPEGCPAGCYPVALAQVMNYWKWPKETQGYLNTIGEYHSDVDFSGHVYDWDNMKDHYGVDYLARPTYNATEANAVAYLLADIGTAFNTEYDPKGSSTSFVVDPLVYNFGYEAQYESHHAESASDLVYYIKMDLDKERPVLYAGGHSHAMVCDGYTSNDYFHFNFGWGGEADGYYLNAACVPYSGNAWIYTGIRPYDAERKVIDGIEYGLLKNGKAEIWNYTLGQFGKENGTLVIPSTVTDNGKVYEVNRIRQQAFYRKGHFDKIIVGDNLEVVDPISFFYTRIDTLILGDGLQAVPEKAFAYTDILHLVIGKNVKRIGKEAFYLCKLNQGVISKSPAFEVGEEAFANTNITKEYEWLNCITSLGRKAFYGAKIDFWKHPEFRNLEVIGDSAFVFASWGNGSPPVRLGSKVREIAPSAFDGINSLSSIIIDEENPYFCSAGSPRSNVYNKNITSLVILKVEPTDPTKFPSSLIKMEPNCCRPSCNYLNGIPNTVVDMRGAFKNAQSISFDNSFTCYAVTPPLLTDDSFSDVVLENLGKMTLYVPEGTEEIYRNAPGWRLFGNIVGDKENDSASAQEREYYMVLEGADGNNQRVSIPLSEVSSIEISDDGEQMIIKRNGKGDITTTVAGVNNITWEPGFVYENAEIFELNESILTAEAQKCKVRFDATCIDEDVQLSVRNALITPAALENMVRGFTVDLSLSNGEHELSGTVEITIPFEVGSDEKVHAGYYNEESGEWEPVLFTYDEQKGEVIITTDHLSAYTIITTIDDTNFTRLAKLKLEWEECPRIYAFNEATKILLDIVSSDDPDKQMINEFKDEMSFWQSVSLDGLWNIVRGVGEVTVDFRPEMLDNAVEAMGYLGTAVSIVNVAGADIKGDDISVASGTLSTIMNFATGQMASAIGTPIMSVSMGCVAFIGIALNNFGTAVQNAARDYFREAYRYYYSKEGYKDLNGDSKYYRGNPDLGNLANQKYPHRYWRTGKDWYDYFYPAFAEGKMKEAQLNTFIEQAVRMYCHRFWDDYEAVRTGAYGEAKRRGFYTFHDIDSEPWLKDQISDEYFAELMNGQLVSVITAIKNHLKVEANNRYVKAAKDVTDIMNTQIGLRFMDSQCKKGEKSKYAGWKVGFSEIPSTLKDRDQWIKTINENGHAGIGRFTEYALIQSGMRTQLTLYNENDVEQKTFTFQVPENTGKVNIDIYIDKDGVEIEVPKLKDLELTHAPDFITYDVVARGKDNTLEPEEYESSFILWNNLHKNVRMQKEIEKYFKKHDFITVDKSGNIKIGDDIMGQFEGDKGTGQFTINTDNVFTESTLEEWVKNFNQYTNMGQVKNAFAVYSFLNGTLSHHIDCQFTVTKSNEDDSYVVDYTGTGTYTLNGQAIKNVNNLTVHDEPVMGLHMPFFVGPISTGDVITQPVNATGDVTLKYTVKLK